MTQCSKDHRIPVQGQFLVSLRVQLVALALPPTLPLTSSYWMIPFSCLLGTEVVGHFSGCQCPASRTPSLVLAVGRLWVRKVCRKVCRPNRISTVFYIAKLEEDFDPVKSRFPDVKGENDFKEKLGNDRKEKGEKARPYVCVLESSCETVFKLCDIM